MRLYCGNCLEVMDDLIAQGVKVDMVLTDPPYGTMDRKGKGFRQRQTNRIDDIVWDFALDAETVLLKCRELLRQNGKMALFSQEPYTSKLIMANTPRIQFIQRLAWEKNVAGNFLCSTQNCMQYIEDICLFRKDCNDYAGEHPLREYFLEEKRKSGLTNKEIEGILQNRMSSHYFTDKIQFSCPTEKNYKKLQSTGYFYKPYDEIKQIDNAYKRRCPSVFNLYGAKGKSNIFKYPKDNNGYHPTQKPVALLEDLILTYSNEGDIILDFTMGSGSTGVACMNAGRDFIGIELDKNYFNIAQNRIQESAAQIRLTI